MSLFSAAAAGAGRAAQGMAQTWIREESAANLQRLNAELDEAKAKTLADLQMRNQRARDDYLVSPEYSGRAATAAGKIKAAEDAAQTRTTSPGQTLVRDGQETYANPNATSAELNYSLYEQGLRAGGGGTGARATASGGGSGGAGGGKAPEDEKARQTRIEKATASIKGTTVGDRIGENPRALAMFQELVSNNPEVAPAQLAIEAMDSIASEDPEYAKKNPKGARQTTRIEFDDAGNPWKVPTVTGERGESRTRGKGQRKKATQVEVIEFVQDTLAPKYVDYQFGVDQTRDQSVKREINTALRAAGMTPADFSRLLEVLQQDRAAGADAREAGVEPKRLQSAQSLFQMQNNPSTAAQQRMGSTQQPGGTVINPITGQPATLAPRR